MDFIPLEWNFQVLDCLTERKQDTWVLLKHSSRAGSIHAWDLALNPGLGELLYAKIWVLAAPKGLCGNSFVFSVALLQGSEKCKKWDLVCVEGLVH